MPEREQECLKVFRTVFCFIEQEAGASHDHLTAVFDKCVKCIHDRELLGAALVNSQHVHPEGCFHGGEFEDLVNNHLWASITLEGDLDASLLIGEVTHCGDFSEDFFTDKLGDALLQYRAVYTVRHVGDGDDGCARGFFLNLHVASHLDATTTSVEVAVDAFEPADFALSGEIRAFDILLQLIDRELGIVDTGANTIDHFAQVVGGDVGSHAHRDTSAAIDQQVGNRGW